ncbi:MAG: hypothetical protein K2X87_02080 [Gemmataceae bacterium]|nr:hypothetical protein [Gemmataceae bacterium]
MRVIRILAVADADGKFRLDLPLGPPGSVYELEVRVEPNYGLDGPPPGPTPEELGWPAGFFDATYGSITDETFVRPPQPIPSREVILD